jgi:hypothetical protein
VPVGTTLLVLKRKTEPPNEEAKVRTWKIMKTDATVTYSSQWKISKSGYAQSVKETFPNSGTVQTSTIEDSPNHNEQNL